VENSERGSDRLVQAWHKHAGITDELVRGLAEATDGLALHNVLVKGQPRPDFLRFAATADDPEVCGNTIRDILAQLQRHPGPSSILKVFPRGIPWPGHFVVDVTVGGPGPVEQL
jgi:hypothetical protein